jgi:signal transduction histidine kinase
VRKLESDQGVVSRLFSESLIGSADPEMIWRARLVYVAWAMVSTLAVFSAVVQALLGSHVVASIGFIFLVAMMAIPLLLRRVNSVPLAAHSLAGGVFVVLTAANLGSAGAAHAATLGLILVPVLAFLAPGRLWPCVWAFVVCAEILATPYLGAAGFVDVIEVDSAFAATALSRVPVLLVLFTLIGGLSADRMISESRRRKQAAKDQLDDLNLENERLISEMLERQKNLAAVGTLTAGMAHQINNPIGSILLVAQFAQIQIQESTGDEAVRDALATIEFEARRCGQIVHSLLKISRGERSEKWKEDIHAIVLAAFNAVQPYAKECSADLRLEADSDSRLYLYVSPIEIEQALVNLIRNGIEACGKEARVIVRTLVEDDHVRIEVEDNGHGLPDENVDRIFETFYTTRHSRGGFGLGLSVVKEIADDHGGCVRARSAPDGSGTVFEFSLPIDDRTPNGSGNEEACDVRN